LHPRVGHAFVFAFWRLEGYSVNVPPPREIPRPCCFFGALFHARKYVACSLQVPYDEGQAYADARGIPFVECSARRNVNVGEVFNTLLREVLTTNKIKGKDSARAKKR